MADKYRTNLAVASVLLFAFSVVGVAYRVFIQPKTDADLVEQTSADSRYKHTVTLRLDSFSGYAPLRSPGFEERLRRAGIRLKLEDDQADYADRLKALKRGKAQLAVFTIDGYVAAGYEAGGFPGSIVAVLDETDGADAVVAYRQAVPDLRALDHDDARVVLTPASPSEFLTRVAIAELGIPGLSRDWVEADGAADVLSRMQSAARTDRTAYALWEPYVAAALEDPDAHVLISSSQLSGYIVDVLVAERRFLAEHPNVVREVVGAWLETTHAVTKDKSWVDLVVQDAERSGESLSRERAEKVVSGIRWRNTLENYAAMGLVPAERADVVHLEDAITNIGDVLRRTGATSADPVAGQAMTLFFPGILQGLMASDFHPAAGGLGTADLERGTQHVVLRSLDAAGWASLVPVGSLEVPPISFGRAKATIHLQGKRELDVLARRLRGLPKFYLTVIGQARAEGDPEANKRLAQARAEAVRTHLIGAGVASARVRAIASMAGGVGGTAQSVRFELGQQAY